MDYTKDKNQTILSEAEIIRRLNGKPLMLVGMMGAGKTTVGRRFANRLGLDFIDSDVEIESAAGMTIPEIFAKHGEQDFRDGEARVIARVLKDHNGVLATGGGAFMNPEVRENVKEYGISIWIKADFELLFSRVSKRQNRPLLQTANPRQTLKDLINNRYPTYSMADVTVESLDVPHEAVVDEMMLQLGMFLMTNQTE